jgi:hypothetical protein
MILKYKYRIEREGRLGEHGIVAVKKKGGVVLYVSYSILMLIGHTH